MFFVYVWSCGWVPFALRFCFFTFCLYLWIRNIMPSNRPAPGPSDESSDTPIFPSSILFLVNPPTHARLAPKHHQAQASEYVTSTTTPSSQPPCVSTPSAARGLVVSVWMKRGILSWSVEFVADSFPPFFFGRSAIRGWILSRNTFDLVFFQKEQWFLNVVSSALRLIYYRQTFCNINVAFFPFYFRLNPKNDLICDWWISLSSCRTTSKEAAWPLQRGSPRTVPTWILRLGGVSWIQ